MNGPLLLAGCAAACSASLLPAPRRTPASSAARPVRRRLVGLVALAVAVVAFLLCMPVTLGRSAGEGTAGALELYGSVTLRPAIPTAVGLLACGGLRVLWNRQRRRRVVQHGQRRVLEFCTHLAAELSAGQPPGAALAQASSGSPDLAGVLTTFGLGGDVPAALREAARCPGQSDLVLVAAAWQLAHQSGAGLALGLSRVAAGLRATQATRRVVHAELSSARATARLMAALPVLALLMGRGLGGDPLAFLVGSTPGTACLVLGLGIAFLGLWWIESIADSVLRGAS